MAMQAKDTIPRVTHLTQFETVMDGLDESITFDELRIRLYQVAIDLARLNGGRETIWSSGLPHVESLPRMP